MFGILEIDEWGRGGRVDRVILPHPTHLHAADRLARGPLHARP